MVLVALRTTCVSGVYTLNGREFYIGLYNLVTWSSAAQACRRLWPKSGAHGEGQGRLLRLRRRSEADTLFSIFGMSEGVVRVRCACRESSVKFLCGWH